MAKQKSVKKLMDFDMPITTDGGYGAHDPFIYTPFKEIKRGKSNGGKIK